MLLWAIIPVVASAITVTHQLSESTLLLGDEITLQLKVDGTQHGVSLNLPHVDGLSFRQLGDPSSSTQTVIINGKVNSFSGLIYTIGISAEKTGTYQVPGIEVMVDNTTYRSQGFTLRVREPGKQTSMKLTSDTDRDQYYLQEPVDIVLRWYIQDDVDDYSFRFPLLDQKDKLALKLNSPESGAETVDLRVSGYKIPFSKSSEMLDDESYTVYRAGFRITPSEPGSFKIPAASVKAMISEGSELRRDMFGRVIRAPKLKRVFAASQTREITIKPLPSANRPASFTGAVGQFRIHASVDHTQVKVGDPIELSIKINGQGRYEAIEPPVLTDIAGMSDRFVIKQTLQPGDIQSDGILFKEIIRARNEYVEQIPAIPFSYFDPQAEKYQTVFSDPIPIKVLKAGRVKAEDIVVSGKGTTPEVESFRKGGKGIYANYIFEDALTSQTINPAWFLLLLCPPLLYFTALVSVSLRQKRQNNRSQVRARSAKKLGMKRLKRLDELISESSDRFYGELSRALRGYISDRFDLGAGELTTIDIHKSQALALLPDSLSDQLIEILDELDRWRFTGQQDEAVHRRELLSRMTDLITQIEAALK